VVANRNSPQKHVWRARIVLLTADGRGTAEIMDIISRAKTVIWRWQERFREEGAAGLWRDKTRPSRIPPLDPAVAERVVAMTLAGPPPAASHWTGSAMAKAAGISVSSVQRIWRAHGLRPHLVRQFKLSNDRNSPANSGRLSASTSIRPIMPWCSRSMRRAKFRRSTARNRDCR
jgi:transposase